MGGSRRVVVVSNRLPARAALDANTDRAGPVGGLVSALMPVMAERGGLWFGWSGAGVKDMAKPALSNIGPITLAAIDLPEEDINLFYTTFANRTLWPLIHGFPGRVVIRTDAFRAYQRVNVAFAEALHPLLRTSDLVWVHDYHLIPLGSILRRLGWQGRLGFFLHTPFPPADVFAVLPWARELLVDCLAYDLFGVHTKRDVHNLLDTLQAELGGSTVEQAYEFDGRRLHVGPFPVGTDPEFFRGLAAQSLSTPTSKRVRLTGTRQQIVLGVDRLDYTKGIPHRLMAFESLLEHYPSLRGKVTLVQIAVPSRTRVREYVHEKEEVERLVGQINGRFSEPGWIPVEYFYRAYAQEELVRFYRSARVCLVTPLRDGMNLVAKEYIASQGANPGVLVLSRFCGAAETMREAIIVNPYDIRATAEALHAALAMPARERRRRWTALYGQVSMATAKEWANAFLTALDSGAVPVRASQTATSSQRSNEVLRASHVERGTSMPPQGRGVEPGHGSRGGDRPWARHLAVTASMSHGGPPWF